MASLKINDGVHDSSADHLQAKLNLKKQIWTGTWNETAIDRTRPLSWGVSHTTIKNTSHYLEVREYDSEQLLIACSRKLTAWQENGNRQVNAKSKTNEKKINRDGAGPHRRLQKGFHVSTASFINRCNITKLNELGKTKKIPQNYALAKIVEATDFIAGLNKGKATGRGQKVMMMTSPQLPKNPQTTSFKTGSNNQTTMTQIARSRTNLTLKKKNKFKTGGIVATAVQSSSSRLQTTPLRRIRLPGAAKRTLGETQEMTLAMGTTSTLVKRLKINKKKKK